MSLLIVNSIISQNLDEEKKYQIGCIAFYNLENLFDTLDTENVNDTEFTPDGKKNWNTKKYYYKQKNMANVISKLAIDNVPNGPAIVGLCEIENSLVLEDLVIQEKIKSRGYKIVHHDGPDRRGIDCALLYNPNSFKLISSSSIELTMPGDTAFRSRDQLLVTGELFGERMHFIVVHWPSRRGGEKKSRHKRMRAASVAKGIIDSIQGIEPNAKIILMGDMNDDPINASMKEVLNAQDNTENTADLYNCMMGHFKKGIGTLAYRDNWNLFDQFVITPSLLSSNNEYSDFKYYSSFVFNKPFLKNKEGNFAGYPHRTFVGSTFLGGYSDHFPVYIYLVKEIK